MMRPWAVPRELKKLSDWGMNDVSWYCRSNQREDPWSGSGGVTAPASIFFDEVRRGAERSIPTFTNRLPRQEGNMLCFRTLCVALCTTALVVAGCEPAEQAQNGGTVITADADNGSGGGADSTPSTDTGGADAKVDGANPAACSDNAGCADGSFCAKSSCADDASGICQQRPEMCDDVRHRTFRDAAGRCHSHHPHSSTSRKKNRRRNPRCRCTPPDSHRQPSHQRRPYRSMALNPRRRRCRCRRLR